ncbi:AMP-binding protein [Brevibacterium samyangense]|uniref:Long-chain fatty acid--CoA ligase n=1 Tax=Brevibacterium samyangense TaxID=366888 RepID=A0ABN2TEH5_9MICO
MLLGHFIENAALREPHLPALRFEDTVLDYGTLADRVTRIANALRSLAPPESRIAFLSGNRAEIVELQTAVPMAGMGCVFVNHRLTPPEIAFILQNSGAHAIAVSDEYRPVVESIRAQLPHLRTLILLDEPADSSAPATGGAAAGSNTTTAEAPLSTQPGGASADGDLSDLQTVPFSQLTAHPDDAPSWADLSEHTLAWLVYTSGTTGRPKGAMISHRNLVSAIANSLAGVDAPKGGRYLNPFPLCHIAAYGSHTRFADRGEIVLQRKFEPELYMRTIAELGISSSSIAPAMLGLILARPELLDTDTSSLRSMAYGASSISPDLLRKSMDLFPNARFTQGFGMTELAGNVVWMDHDMHLAGLEPGSTLLSAAGKVAPFAAVRVVDPMGEPVPNGKVGEIEVRADQVMLGYWQNPEATAEVMHDGWYATGDIGRFTDEGVLYIVDRKKDMIVTGGLNVYSREVEDVIADHPDVVDVAVIGVPEDIWGESVCAVIVRREGSDLDFDGVVAHVKTRLASFKKPKYVEFRDELPRNPTGKVLKRDLRESVAVGQGAESPGAVAPGAGVPE